MPTPHSICWVICVICSQLALAMENPSAQPNSPKSIFDQDSPADTRRPAPVAGSPAVPPANAPAPPRLPLPDAAARKQADHLIAELYKSQIDAAKKPADRALLASQFVNLARESAQDPAGRYALLQRAIDLSADAGDAETVLAAIDEIERVFDVDVAPLRNESFAKLLRTTRIIGDPSAIALSMGGTIDQAVAAEHYSDAARWCDVFQALSRRADSPSLVIIAVARTKRIRALAAARAEAERAIEILKTKPADPAASLKAGRFLCFFKEDWQGGLPLLAHCGEAAYKGAASLELAGGADSRSQLAIADAWWSLAQTDRTPARQAILLHAANFYRRVQPQLGGLEQARVAKRLEEIAKIAGDSSALPGLIVEALIDGDSELHITIDGIYWKEVANVAKPGLHGGKHEPTYINGQPWQPVWSDPQHDRGVDQTQLFKLPILTLDFELEIISISKQRGAPGIDQRDPVTLRPARGEQIVSIPDRQVDSRWYRLRLRRKPQQANP